MLPLTTLAVQLLTGRYRRCWAGATAAVVATLYLSEELEGRSV